jgi:hypothetical protein
MRDGEPIDGATGNTYTVGEDDIGTEISVIVKPKNDTPFTGSTEGTFDGEIKALVSVVSGTVIIDNATGKTVTSWSGVSAVFTNNSTLETFTAVATGVNFSVNLPDGTYTAVITADACTKLTVTGIVVNGAAKTVNVSGGLKIYAGDLDGNGIINKNDVTKILANSGQIFANMILNGDIDQNGQIVKADAVNCLMNDAKASTTAACI